MCDELGGQLLAIRKDLSDFANQCEVVTLLVTDKDLQDPVMSGCHDIPGVVSTMRDG